MKRQNINRKRPQQEIKLTVIIKLASLVECAVYCKGSPPPKKKKKKKIFFGGRFLPNVGGLIPNKIPSKSPQITPKIAFFDPNFKDLGKFCPKKSFLVLGLP